MSDEIAVPKSEMQSVVSTTGKRRKNVRAELQSQLGDVSELAKFRSDLALLVSYAELYSVPRHQIMSLRAEYARRRNRLTPADAVTALNKLGINSSIYKGDLKDLMEITGPVLAVMKSSAFAMVLMAEPRVIVIQVGYKLHPVTLRPQDFDRQWMQSWIATTSKE